MLFRFYHAIVDSLGHVTPCKSTNIRYTLRCFMTCLYFLVIGSFFTVDFHFVIGSSFTIGFHFVIGSFFIIDFFFSWWALSPKPSVTCYMMALLSLPADSHSSARVLGQLSQVKVVIAGFGLWRNRYSWPEREKKGHSRLSSLILLQASTC